MSPDAFAALVRAMTDRDVRFVVIGVWGANYYAPSSGVVFDTFDRDLFLPPDAGNLLRAWEAAEAADFELWAGNEPLDRPRDEQLARAVVDRHALVRAVGPGDLQVDLTLVMAGFDFETVWRERRVFLLEDKVPVPVARLLHIVQSKQTAGRKKDRRFLDTHEEALRQLLGDD